MVFVFVVLIFVLIPNPNPQCNHNGEGLGNLECDSPKWLWRKLTPPHTRVWQKCNPKFRKTKDCENDSKQKRKETNKNITPAISLHCLRVHQTWVSKDGKHFLSAFAPSTSIVLSVLVHTSHINDTSHQVTHINAHTHNSSQGVWGVSSVPSTDSVPLLPHL